MDVGRIVEGDEDGIVVNADVAIESLEEIAPEMRGIPGSKGSTEALAELVGGGLSDESQGHLAVPDMEVEGSGAVPAERLIGLEELFNVPAFGIVVTKEWDIVAA